MSYVIYIIPLVLFIGTTLYYNVKSGTYYSNKLVVGFSILDVITVYSFSMAFLSRIITPQITNIFIYLSIFSVTLLIQITLFEKMVGGTADAIKTLKENIAILFTSFVPFLLFLYFFRQVNYDSLRVLLAVVFSFLIFYISLFIRMNLPKYVRMKNEKLNVSYRTRVTLFAVALSVIVLSSIGVFRGTINLDEKLFLDTDALLYISHRDTYDEFDWENTTVVEAKSIKDDYDFTEKVVFILRDAQDMEYFVIYYKLAIDSNSYFIDFPLTTNTEDTGASQTRIVGEDSFYIATNGGLYLYDDSDMNVVSGTTGKKVEHFTSAGTDRFVVHQGIQGFDVINKNGVLIDNFTARGIQIINDTLFIVNDEEYILYSNPEITYEKLEYTEPYYSAYNESFYQVEYYEKTVLISIENNDTLRNVTIPREKGDTIIPVLKGLVYNPRQFAFKDKITPLNSGIDIYTAQNSLNSYDTFLRYDSSNQVEYIGLSDVHILNIINESGLTKYEIGEFEFYSDDEILISNTRNVIARYVFTAALFIIIPVVSYYSPIAILSFDEIAYKKSKKN